MSYTAPESTTEIYGDAGNDNIYVANVGSDLVYGGTGDDSVTIELHSIAYAEAQSRLIGITQGFDLYDGGDGNDTIQFNYSYEGSYVGINANLENESVSYNATNHSLIGFENVTGTRLDDIIVGSDADNTLEGSEGTTY